MSTNVGRRGRRRTRTRPEEAFSDRRPPMRSTSSASPAAGSVTVCSASRLHKAQMERLPPASRNR